MCLITEKKKLVKIRKDRIVYKLVYDYRPEGNILSPMRYFKWDLETLYKTDLELTNNPVPFDALVNEKYGDSITLERKFERGEIISIGKGFHSFTRRNRKRPKLSLSQRLAKCVIPKGSLIYTDSTGLIVSNQIIMKEILL